jgi:hypothetical protein
MKNQKEILAWLKANHGKRCVGGLTLTDTFALVTSVNLSNLIGYESAPPELFQAYGSIVAQMQPCNRWLAYQSIAMELDWSHRSMIWRMAALPEGDKPATIAAFEPGGSRVDQSKIK